MEAVSPRFFDSFREPVAVGADPLAEKATEEVTCPVAVDIEIAGDPDSCYVCLSSEGALLMNVCDCRWARIHPECLGKLLKEQKSSECKVRIRATLFFFPLGRGIRFLLTVLGARLVCSQVCRATMSDPCNNAIGAECDSLRKICESRQRARNLLELDAVAGLLWTRHPREARVHTVASLFVACVGTGIVAWGGLLLYYQLKEARRRTECLQNVPVNGDSDLCPQPEHGPEWLLLIISGAVISAFGTRWFYYLVHSCAAMHVVQSVA